MTRGEAVDGVSNGEVWGSGRELSTVSDQKCDWKGLL